MLKITAIGNLTNDVELKMNETTGKPYAILRIASDRRYKDKDGNKLTDFISIKVRGPLAERCAEFAWKGCKLAASGDFETITFDVAYCGDDLNDLTAMALCGFVACPADAAGPVLGRADFICRQKGGEGAVRGTVEEILLRDGRLPASVKKAFGAKI